VRAYAFRRSGPSLSAKYRRGSYGPGPSISQVGHSAGNACNGERGSSDNAFEFGLLGDTFVRFIGALHAVQPFVALDGKQLRYCIYAA
jgi:hypothetical protein